MYLVWDLVSARTWLALIHHLAGLFIGFAVIFIVVFGLGFGFGTVPLALVGLPLLGITLRFTDWFGRFERARFALLLGAAIPAWPEDPRPGYHWVLIPSWRKLGARATWSEIGYALVRLPVSVVTAAVSFSVATVSLVLITLPLYNWALPRGGAVLGGTVLRGGPVMAASAVGGLLLLLASAQLARGLAVADTAVSRRLLGPPSQLAARVTQLERSRERVVDAAENERRRIERDLHDGAQQRLVAVAMELGRAKAKFGDDPEGARELIDQAHAQAKEALTELRNLVRGVHPPVLTDRGLDAALSGLAAVCPIPVEMHVDVAVRPKPAVEAVAYFVVAESLTNVAKHARASQVRVMVEGHGFPGSLTVLISDDGIGGADARGAGLSGLADRVSGVDGELSVESPSGGPTIISAVLPCG
jgi:signal transduction histidine kinase